jgi:putative ABC transport system permease protein
MGRLLLAGRLAVRDLRRRQAEAALLLLAIMAATTTLTLGLVLREAGSEPYQSTREATAGPDVIASVGPDEFDGTPTDLASLEALTDAPDVIGHSGPYPMIGAELEASGGTAGVWAQGRDPAEASVDQPELIQGSWVREGSLVVEAGLAEAVGVGQGDQVTVGGRSFQVVGVAVTAAANPIRPRASPHATSAPGSPMKMNYHRHLMGPNQNRPMCRASLSGRGLAIPAWSGSPRQTPAASPRRRTPCPTS